MAKMGRPPTTIERKKILGTYRPDRHAKPRQPAPKGAAKHTEAEECELWADLFETGYSAFFAGDLESLGFVDKYAANLAAGAAWTRLGEYYLKNIRPSLGRPPAIMPWALSTFGKPWTASGTPWDPPK
jgi:hypothetical protein